MGAVAHFWYGFGGLVDQFDIDSSAQSSNLTWNKPPATWRKRSTILSIHSLTVTLWETTRTRVSDDS